MSAEATYPDQAVVGAGSAAPNLPFREAQARVMAILLFLATILALVALAVLLWTVVERGWSWLNLGLLTNAPSRWPERSGLQPALIGTALVMMVTALFALPVGILGAIYLQEYAPRNLWTRILQINVANLAGVPSIVYGLLGLGIFVEFFRFGRSILSGGLALGLLILPIIIIASQEALKAVPPSLREAAYGLGATKWQVVRHHVLPAALPGILTGAILAIATGLGETAPLLVTGASAYVTFNPRGLLDGYTVVPVQIYNWTSRPQQEFRELAAAGIIVMMVILLIMNGTAIVLRQRFGRNLRW